MRVRRTPSPTTRGNTASYVNNAAAVWIEKGENITVRNNILHDSGNGLFVSSAEPFISRNILVEGNYIYDNGNANSLFEHNTYTAALGITYQFNRFGPLRSRALGNNLKDRSAGLVVRYNWIEGGNRQLDLVETDSATIQNDPSYRDTHVYGNVLIEPAAAGNRQITHYGGDNGTTANYRKGTLYFYQNTLVSTRTDRTTLFRLSTNEEHADARNNIFYPCRAHRPEPVAARRHRHPEPHAQLVQGRATSAASAASPASSPTTARRCWGTRRASSAKRRRTSA